MTSTDATTGARARPTLDLTGLPAVDGVRLRLVTDLDADLEALWAVEDAASTADGEMERSSLSSFAADYHHLERCVPARDLLIADAAGRVIGFSRVEWQDSNDGERWYESVGIVHPAWRRRRIGTMLLAWSERRRGEIAASQAAAGEVTGRVRAFTTFLLDGDRGGAVLLRQAGYAPFRQFASMQRPDLADVVDHPLPDGFEIRSVPGERSAMRQVFDADAEAFRDHFGWSQASDEKFAALLEDPETDPALWVVAFDGDQVAGAVLNGIHVDADGEPSGWLDSIFVRRPWRQRGLARALIARSLHLLRDRGLTTASLGVDIANVNEALRLYEACGFRVVSRATAYRKPLPPEPQASAAGGS